MQSIKFVFVPHETRCFALRFFILLPWIGFSIHGRRIIKNATQSKAFHELKRNALQEEEALRCSPHNLRRQGKNFREKKSSVKNNKMLSRIQNQS